MMDDINELIVSGENVLNPTDFTRNKQELEQMKSDIPNEVSLPDFKEKVGLFRANVKGDDINRLVDSIQECFMFCYNSERKLYSCSETTYNAIESLDKGYIEGILIAVKSGQKALEEAQLAIDKIDATLQILSKFKNRLEENTQHLNDIDTIWNDTQALDDKLQTLERELNEKSEYIKLKLNQFSSFQSSLEKIAHLKDVDRMYENLDTVNADFSDFKSSYMKQTDEFSTQLSELSSFKSQIQEFNHISDIDTEWEFSHNLSKTESEHHSELSNCQQDHDQILKSLTEYCELLKKYTYLPKIDIMWEQIQEVISKVNIQGNDISTLSTQHIEDVLKLNKKIKILWYALGGTASLLVVQFILNLLGII